jgi:integrase/recombinase XerD
VRCCSKQAKYFLAAAGGPEAVRALDAGKVTAFMVDWSRDATTGSAKAMGNVASRVPAVRARDRQDDDPAGRGGVGRRASWKMAALPRGLTEAEIGQLLAGCDRQTAAGLRDYAVLSLLARLGLRGAEAAGLRLDDIDWRPGEIAVTGKGSRAERLPLPARAGDRDAGWRADDRAMAVPGPGSLTCEASRRCPDAATGIPSEDDDDH